MPGKRNSSTPDPVLKRLHKLQPHMRPTLFFVFKENPYKAQNQCLKPVLQSVPGKFSGDQNTLNVRLINRPDSALVYSSLAYGI